MEKTHMFSVLVILTLALSSCTLFGAQEEKPVPPKVLSMWAYIAEASSSYGGIGENRDDYSAYAATGSPDVTVCEDNPRAWLPDGENIGEQWLVVGYDAPLYISNVLVRESFAPGAIIKIEAFDEDSNEYKLFWEGSYKTKLCPNDFTASYSQIIGNITYGMMSFKSEKIKITLDTDKAGWNEIDAVQVKGYEQKWYSYNDTLTIE